MPRTTIERTDDGATLGSVDDLDVRGFSGDGSMLVGLSGSARTPVLIDWRGGRRVWSAERGMYMGYLSEPGGGHVVVGLVSADGYLGDAYLVGPEGASVRLPERISAGLH